MSQQKVTAERFARVRDVFITAARLVGSERDVYLLDACVGDPALEDEVRELLALDGLDDEAVNAIITDVAQELTGSMERDMSAEAVGPYRILAALGRGGMGSVWLAERADGQFEQQVAIKIVDKSRATRELVSRFRSERQILAGLDHPNIARLFDGGETDDGVPYLVMEYVDGIPVDQYCDERRLSIRERLELFIDVCAAIEYAHGNLVVHRDIKASNVLVTAEGEPKLLDFGIAKLIDIERARSLDLHLTGDVSRLMTPATASPEQLHGKLVTTATDVYALGHLLYRLLTGTEPYDVDPTDRLSLPRAILDDEPVPPSATARSSAEAAAARGTTPDRLARELAGDLDAIVLKTLRKTPADRYAAPRELVEDLERHLAHRPVRARGDAFSYVTRRFVARNRGALAAAVSVVVLIATLVTFYTIQLAEERDRARIEARRAEEVATFLTDLFEMTTPDESRGSEVTAREMLDRGAERIGVELAAEPTVQVSLMHVMGMAYAKLGLYDTSVETLESALAKRDEFGIPEDAELGTTLHNLGVVHLIETRYDVAGPLLDRALEVRRRVHGPLHADIVETLRAQSSHFYELADYEQAAVLLDEAESVARAIQSDEPLALANVLNSRADLLDKLGDYDAAIDAYRGAIEIRTEISGDDHPRTLGAIHGLADTLNTAGRREESEAISRQLLEARRRVLPAGHPEIADALSGLATSLKYQGRPEEALPLQEEALAILRAAHSGDQRDVSTALNNLANIRHDLRDLDGALEMHEEALAMSRRIYGEDHSLLANNYNNIAAIQADRGDFAGALPMYQRTLELDRASLGDDHPYVHHDRLAIGTMRGLLGQVEQAEVMLRGALADIRRVSGEDHPQTFNAMRELGIFLQREGRCDEAEPFLAEALPGLERVFPGDPWQVAMARVYLGTCRSTADPDTGEALMRQAYERLVELRGHDDRMTNQAREHLTQFLRSSDREVEALALELAATAAQ